MRRHTYNKELHNYIKKTECEIVGDNVVGSLDRRVRKLERSGLSAVLPFLKKCRNPRPGTPRLFAFAKTHKTGMELRPVVEKCRGPTFILEKRLHGYLSSHLDDDNLVAQDPLIVVKEIQDISLMEDEVATVLDYESMYPSVMIESCVDALLDFLYIKNSQLLLYTQELEELANLVCCESCFIFCGQIYRQKRGVPMGSPLSGILCELVVRRLERRVLHGFKDDIVYFSRYVDDILILWKNNRRVHEFMSRINDNNDGLRLRLEQKSSMNVHFLDINIRFMKGHLSTSVYIKPTHTPLYIPSQSMDPYQYKMAAFRALIRRAYLYCDQIADREKEIDRVLQVARTLGYRKSVIVGMLKKYERGIVKRTLRNVPTRLTKFTYNSSMNSVMKEIARRKESRMVLRRAPNLYKILRNDKDNIRAEERAGVYKIPYENLQLDVKKDYIGVTTRNLGVRLKEHRYAIRKASNSTVLSQMAQTQGSEVKWDEATIIKPLSSPTLAMTAEKIEIYRSKIREGCLNARDSESLPSAWKYLVKKFTRNFDQN
ncbi:uncharacterized protein LOC111620245 [Centruroides sculpturatus]|uniref:uncharacterized protein LOC111620245 n=1 Tax=Centruroides sculpturatus TaxID=218467 RepID=UPI000C6D73F9|nr:uncharacterized protein LOC111620245 [Centruroides sculpturatus]